MQTTKSLKRRYNGRVQRGVFVHSAVNTAAPGISIQPTPLLIHNHSGPPFTPTRLDSVAWFNKNILKKTKQTKPCTDCVSDQRKRKAASLNPAWICDQQIQIMNLKKEEEKKKTPECINDHSSFALTVYCTIVAACGDRRAPHAVTWW